MNMMQLLYTAYAVQQEFEDCEWRLLFTDVTGKMVKKNSLSQFLLDGNMLVYPLIF